MARVLPFTALRPKPAYAHLVAAPPYDVVTTEEARKLAKDNAYSFLHVDKAEIDLPASTNPMDAVVYAKAHENLTRLVSEGVLIREAKPCLYIYRLTAGDRSQTGLAACVGVDAYDQGYIKKHELTHPEKEQDRVNHINACNAHTGPIFMAFREQPEHCDLMQAWTEVHAPVYDFSAEDGIRHTLWVVDEEDAINALTDAFEKLQCLYIADGHHRSAAAASVAKMRRAMPPTMGKIEMDCDFFLSILFPHHELTILDYNRLVKDLNGLDADAFLTELGEFFMVQKCDNPVKPSHSHEFGLYMADGWYKLQLKSNPPDDVVEGLAVSVLQNKVLSPILGITDPKTDKRVDFVGGARGIEGITYRVDSGEMAAGFMLYPTTMHELMTVADAERIMPPKSTWFEPKLRSGLLIHTF